MKGFPGPCIAGLACWALPAPAAGAGITDDCDTASYTSSSKDDEPVPLSLMTKLDTVQAFTTRTVRAIRTNGRNWPMPRPAQAVSKG
jgi:hypothetical protein